MAPRLAPHASISGSLISLTSDSPSGVTLSGSFQGSNISQSHREIQGGVRAQDESHGYETIIDILSDDVLLDIFDICAEEWDMLVHVCRRWRQLVFASPRRLQIQLHCKPGTPVRTHLSYWPAFPVIVQYSFNSLAPSDVDNVIAALQHSNRVCELDLTVKNPQLAKLVTVMQQSYPALEYLALSFGRDAPVLPDGFLGGSVPCLRVLDFEAVPFPALPALISSASDLGELRLYDIPKSGYISPEAMVAGLASLTSLWFLRIAFKSKNSCPDQNSVPPVTRVVLPALSSFEFQGASDYLEDLVTRIDCPKLRWIKIWYLCRRTSFRAAHLLQLIDRSENHWVRQCRWFDVHFFPEGDICLDFAYLRDLVPTCITFQGSNWGDSHLVQMFRQFSPKLSTVRHLSIAYGRLSAGMGQIEWGQLLHLFTAAQTLHVCRDGVCHDPPTVEGVTTDMVIGADPEILPALGLLFLEHQRQVPCLAFFENLVAARQLSSCPVTAVVCKSEFEKRFKSYLSEEDKDIFRFVKIFNPGDMIKFKSLIHDVGL
ncbi:hypothetical protein V8E53_007504 [Lactarius tabidus]